MGQSEPNRQIKANLTREIKRLGSDAAEAVARRDRAYFAAQKRRPWELAWTVVVSIVGLLVFNWSPASIWVFLMLGLWGGLLQSGLKLAVARGAVNRYYEAYSRDAQVWAVVSALRHDRYHREVQAAERSWSPHSLWLLDLGMLTAACGVMFLAAYARELMLPFASRLIRKLSIRIETQDMQTRAWTH